jgi:hypothetical protein
MVSSPDLNAQSADECSQPTKAEVDALEQSGPLVRFACENIPRIDRDLLLSIAVAVDAQCKKQWSPAISQKFWGAFNMLCEKIKPVTIDCLTTRHKNIPRRRLIRFWAAPLLESLGERSSRKYMAMLFVMLALMVPLHLFVWTCTNLQGELNQKSLALNVSMADLSLKCDTLKKRMGTANEKSYVWTPENLAAFDAIDSAEGDLNGQSSQLKESSRLLESVIPSSATSVSTVNERGVVIGDDWSLRCADSLNLARMAKQYAATVTARANLVGAILLQFVLPILLGIIGAIAYVLRSTSEQIKNSTFSTTSPIRNLVRIMLGALMGVVIGLFGGLSNQISLPPLAMAFLAGYGVEAVFSVFDGFIERLRNPASPGK